jgi:hypothetical protein
VSKAIFLDFDGPLHPTDSIRGMGGQVTQHEIDKRGLFRWVKNLEQIIESAPPETKENLFIAVHSSWRALRGLDQELIRKNLGGLSMYYIGMTDPELGRWQSIVEMCKRGGLEDIIIIDDATSEFPDGLKELVRCSPITGLSDPLVLERIGGWLKESRTHKPLLSCEP